MGNDDDDVETVQTAEAESLLPMDNIQNNHSNHKENLEQDYPSDPNETDQVSRNNFQSPFHKFIQCEQNFLSYSITFYCCENVENLSFFFAFDIRL